MFEKNDRVLLTTRIIILVTVIVLAVASLASGIVLAVVVAPLYCLFTLAGWFVCWLIWIFARLYMSYLCDVKLIRNKLYDESNYNLYAFGVNDCDPQPTTTQATKPPKVKVKKLDKFDVELDQLSKSLTTGSITAEEYKTKVNELTKSNKLRGKVLQWISLCAAVITLISLAFPILIFRDPWDIPRYGHSLSGFGFMQSKLWGDMLIPINCISLGLFIITIVFIVLSIIAIIKPLTPKAVMLAQRTIVACSAISIIYMLFGIVVAILWGDATTGAYGAVIINAVVTAAYFIYDKFYLEINKFFSKQSKESPRQQ